MAQIPPAYLDCVVAIGVESPAGGTQFVATGFLLGRCIKFGTGGANNRYRVFLVTNRHVLEDMRTVVLRFNVSDDKPAKAYGLDLVDGTGNRKWHAHPDPDVDLAVASINVALLRQDGIQFSYFQSDSSVLNRRLATEAGVSEGDGVFTLGFPLGDTGKTRNYVIVRQGSIARVRDCLGGYSKTLLIDSTVFPGNSGGPVVTRAEMTGIEGTKMVQFSKLLGVISGFVPYQDVAISAQTKRPRVVFEENTGLAVVVPIEYASEIIEPLISESDRASAPPIGRD